MDHFPSFFIEKQESLAFDKFSRNGLTVDLHLVAKNIAFVIHLSASFDLAKFPPAAKLVYDGPSYDQEEREVEAVKSTTLEIVSHVDETGLKAAVEVKVGVLSSQHEGSFFRVKFLARDPITGVPLVDFTQPIKVISKRNQVKKILERKEAKVNDNKVSKKPTTPQTSPSQEPIVGFKRQRSDDSVSDSLARLEKQQQTQLAMLEQLLSRENSYKEEMDFETAFWNLLNAYKRLPPEERPSKVQRVMRSVCENENLSDLIDLFSFQSCGRGINTEENILSNPCLTAFPSCTDKGCDGDDCPHKKQLERLDDLYNDFLLEPFSPITP